MLAIRKVLEGGCEGGGDPLDEIAQILADAGYRCRDVDEPA